MTIRQLSTGSWYCAECNITFAPGGPGDVACPECGQIPQVPDGEPEPEEPSAEVTDAVPVDFAIAPPPPVAPAGEVPLDPAPTADSLLADFDSHAKRSLTATGLTLAGCFLLLLATAGFFAFPRLRATIALRRALPAEDRDREFGKDGFYVVNKLLNNDHSLFLMSGLVGVRDGTLTHSLPGAVFVVGITNWVSFGGKRFTSRQIVLLTSEHEHVLAPPGLELRIPSCITVMGKEYGPGTFTVPPDSMLPESI